MQIYAYNSSGFGNAVFSHLSAILFTILFDAEIINIQNKDDIAYYKTNYRRIDDAEFIKIVEAKINENKNTHIYLDYCRDFSVYPDTNL